jgi:hypothetical protein
MGDPWTIIGWTIIVGGVLAAVAWFVLVGKAHLDQALSNRERRRADAGKVKCYEEKCTKISTRVTPNGYYCDDHFGANSKKHTEFGSWSWAHKLNHTLKGG